MRINNTGNFTESIIQFSDQRHNVFGFSTNKLNINRCRHPKIKRLTDLIGGLKKELYTGEAIR